MGHELQPLGRWLMVIGALLIGIGLIVSVMPRVPWLGRLPGDILIQRERMTFYFPIASCLLISLILSLILWLIGQLRR